MTNRVREHIKFLKDAGIELIDISMTGSCHHKIKVRYHDRERFFIAPYSASDRRGFSNWKADVRRWLRSVAGKKDGPGGRQGMGNVPRGQWTAETPRERR